MAATSSAAWPPRRAWRSCSCSSSSAGTLVDIGQLLCMSRLLQQDIQRGKVGVPFDQSGHEPEATERRGVEFPDRLCDPGAVVVYENVRVIGDVMARKMYLADRFRGQSVEVGDRVEREISRADIDIVDIAEDPAASSAGCFRQKFFLGDGRMAKAYVGGRVLDY